MSCSRKRLGVACLLVFAAGLVEHGFFSAEAFAGKGGRQGKKGSSSASLRTQGRGRRDRRARVREHARLLRRAVTPLAPLSALLGEPDTAVASALQKARVEVHGRVQQSEALLADFPTVPKPAEEPAASRVTLRRVGNVDGADVYEVVGSEPIEPAVSGSVGGVPARKLKDLPERSRVERALQQQRSRLAMLDLAISDHRDLGELENDVQRAERALSEHSTVVNATGAVKLVTLLPALHGVEYLRREAHALVEAVDREVLRPNPDAEPAASAASAEASPREASADVHAEVQGAEHNHADLGIQLSGSEEHLEERFRLRHDAYRRIAARATRLRDGAESAMQRLKARLPDAERADAVVLLAQLGGVPMTPAELMATVTPVRHIARRRDPSSRDEDDDEAPKRQGNPSRKHEGARHFLWHLGQQTLGDLKQEGLALTLRARARALGKQDATAEGIATSVETEVEKLIAEGFEVTARETASVMNFGTDAEDRAARAERFRHAQQVARMLEPLRNNAAAAAVFFRIDTPYDLPPNRTRYVGIGVGRYRGAVHGALIELLARTLNDLAGNDVALHFTPRIGRSDRSAVAVRLNRLRTDVPILKQVGATGGARTWRRFYHDRPEGTRVFDAGAYRLAVNILAQNALVAGRTGENADAVTLASWARNRYADGIPIADIGLRPEDAPTFAARVQAIFGTSVEGNALSAELREGYMVRYDANAADGKGAIVLAPTPGT